jgi:hypothetical protein
MRIHGRRLGLEASVAGIPKMIPVPDWDEGRSEAEHAEMKCAASPGGTFLF